MLVLLAFDIMHILNKIKTAESALQEKMQKYMDQLFLKKPSLFQFYQNELWILLKLISHVQFADENKIDKNVKFWARQFLTQELYWHHYGSEIHINKQDIYLKLPLSAKFVALKKAEQIQQAFNSETEAHSSETEANCQPQTFLEADLSPKIGLAMETMFTEGFKKTPYDLLLSAKRSGSLSQSHASLVEAAIDYALSFAHLALISPEEIFQAARFLILEKLQISKGTDASTGKGCQNCQCYQIKQYLRQAIDVVLSDNSEEEQILESLRLTYLVQQS